MITDETNSASVTIKGHILKERGVWDSDYFVFDTRDENYEGSFNNYNFRVEIASATPDLYSIYVYKGGQSTSNVECDTATYTEYNDCVLDNPRVLITREPTPISVQTQQAASTMPATI